MPHEIFAFPILDKWLIHAPLLDLKALVNHSAVRQLREFEVGQSDNAALASLHAALTSAPPSRPESLSGECAPDFLGFITTRACNIGCLYCDFGGPTAKKVDLDPQVAVTAIDWMADRLVSANRRDFHVHLFGGEPFHAPDAVDLIVHRTRQVCAERDLDPWFEVSTNGVFNESRARFVGDYLDVVILSFDGPAEFHDRNRPAFDGRATFDRVDLTARRLSQAPVKLCLRACITHESVEHMEAITDWMIDRYRPALINHEPLTENELTRRSGLRAPDPYAFARNWIRSYRRAAERGIRLVYSAAEAEGPRLSSCPVGTDTVIVSPDGRASACYMLPEDWQARGMDLDLGWVGRDGLVQIDPAAVDNARQLVTDKPRCEKCFCQWSCAGGCHVTQTYNNCSIEYNDFCLQTRLVTACLMLEELGEHAMVDRLLSDTEEMRRLAQHEWDCLPLSLREHQNV